MERISKMSRPLRSFIDRVRNTGLARTNRYEVSVMFPNNRDGELNSITTLFCDSVNLPGMNINTQPHIVFGEGREMPYGRMFDPVTLSFYMDSGLLIKQAFEDWMNMIVDKNSRAINYYNNYISEVVIAVENVDESNPYTVILHEAYPKTMNSIQLSSESRDIMRLNVTFAYKYWTVESSAIAPTRSSEFLEEIFQDPQSVNTDTGYLDF